jgi:2-polyprenyl-3-methyl-5-hydroxy-6-metoxy-1,4-benzoquinol methylase
MDYKEFDFEGEETLKAVAEAGDFNKWMYNTIMPFCKGRILEIGSGIGNISCFFAEEGKDIVLSDIRAQYRNFLHSRFDQKHINILNIDIVAENFNEATKDIAQSFDTVFALNVIEHIADDKTAISNMLNLLKPGGHLVILVPAFQFLFNNFDSELMHYRRYNKKSLSSLLANTGKADLKQCFYFNTLGIAGWFVAGSILKKKIIPSQNMKLFNKLVPLAKLMDIPTRSFAGLSVVAFAEKHKT